MGKYIEDYTQLLITLRRFEAYISEIDGTNTNIGISFKEGILDCEEGYKSNIIIPKAREIMNTNTWAEDIIGTGKIFKAIYNTFSICIGKSKNGKIYNNLVYGNQKVSFKNKCDDSLIEAETALFQLYTAQGVDEEKEAFSGLTNVFGRKYDLIAYLFFLKDPSRYLPCVPRNFDKAFEAIGAYPRMSNKLTWDNYNEFINTVVEVKNFLNENAHMRGGAEVTLVDAHSFLWIIRPNETETESDEIRTPYCKWTPNRDILAAIEIEIETDLEEFQYAEGKGGRLERGRGKGSFNRSLKVAKQTKLRAMGVCQLCNSDAPFKNKKGEPYLEVHHIISLADGGKDNTHNTVALCPNCHRRMHVLEIPEDIQKLKDAIKNI